MFLFVDKPDKLTFSPEPTLNDNNKLAVKEGDTIGPFICSADCNPHCDISWKLRTSSVFSDPPSKDGMLLPLVVKRNVEMFRCIAQRRYNNETTIEEVVLDVKCKF